MAPALPGGVSPTTHGKQMIMTNKSLPLPARTTPGQQGARSQLIPRLGPKNVTLGVTLELTRGHDLGLRPGKTVSFKQMSPISFAKFLMQTIGEPETCERLQNRSYFVKCTSQGHSDKFLSVSPIGSIEVETFPHASLNAIKGAITSENLCKNSDEEVLEWLT